MQLRFMTTLLISGLLSASVYAAPGVKTTTDNPAQSAKPVDTNKVSYSIGYTMGLNLIQEFNTLNQAELVAGFQQGLAGSQAKFTKEDMQATLIAFQQQAMQNRYSQLQKLSDSNKTEAAKFFANNKSKPGVVALSSGLQYKVVKPGQGAKPTESDRVFVKYTGKLLNGEVFDSSDELGDKPASFTLKGVIPGWTEALKLMPKGSTWEVYVPANLAYGESGTRGKIGPNAALIFTIQLIDIQPGSQSAQGVNSKNS
ncbi:MAG: FKBP-type peptidyl-prolyl cis-trans isomerase [Pseudomonadota bacterium]|nr:FKBP-type peptidyl-prolyl cis-trans isomerase [Pseudomonadota bacterium]